MPAQGRGERDGFGNENSWRSPDRSPQPSGSAEGQTRLRGGILVDELNDRLPETLGPLAAGNGGLGLDLWQGSQRRDIIELLREQPRGQRNPAARDLIRRLLLSSARPPREGESSDQPELLDARAQLLMALGEYDNLVNLLVQIPGLEKAPELAQLQVEAALLADEPEAACPMVRRALSLHRSRTFWPKAQIYCQIRNGEESAAGIGIGLQREVGSSDRGFLNLADAALGVGDVPRLSEPSALDLALLRWMGAGEALVPEDLAPSLMAGGVLLQGLEADQRQRLAEEAARRGVLPLRLLREAYAASSLRDDGGGDPLRQASQAEGPEARALYYQALRRASTPEARGEALQALMDSARQVDLEPQIAEIALPVLEQMDPEPAVAWLAPTAVRVALLTGHFERARAWMEVVRRTGNGSEAQASLVELWPLLRLAGLEGLDPGMTGTDWAETRVSRGAGREGTRALLQFYERAQEAVSGRGGLENASARLRRAVQEDRRGEGLLLSLRVFGQGRMTDISTRSLSEALAALNQLGFSREARQLAMDALVTRGL